VIWRLIQDYVISPRIMGVSVELQPLAALFGILAGVKLQESSASISQFL